MGSLSFFTNVFSHGDFRMVIKVNKYAQHYIFGILPNLPSQQLIPSMHSYRKSQIWQRVVPKYFCTYFHYTVVKNEVFAQSLGNKGMERKLFVQGLQMDFFIMWYTARCEVLAMYYLVPILLNLPLISMYFVLNTTFACTPRHIFMVGYVRCTLVLTVVRCRYAWSLRGLG